MKRRKAFVLVGVLIVALLLGGCGHTTTPEDRIVQDPFGDDVVIPAEISGIVARVNTASYAAAMGKAELIKAHICDKCG